MHIDLLYAAIVVFVATIIAVMITEAWQAHKRENARRYS